MARKGVGITKTERSSIISLFLGVLVFIMVSEPLEEFLARTFTSLIAQLLSALLVVIIIARITKLEI